MRPPGGPTPARGRRRGVGGHGGRGLPGYGVAGPARRGLVDVTAVVPAPAVGGGLRCRLLGGRRLGRRLGGHDRRGGGCGRGGCGRPAGGRGRGPRVIRHRRRCRSRRRGHRSRGGRLGGSRGRWGARGTALPGRRLPGFRRPPVRTAEQVHRFGGCPTELRRLRLGGHVDDRAFLGARLGLRAGRGVDPAGDHPARRAVGLQGGARLQIGVEQDLQIGAQRREFGAQCGHLVGGLGTQLGRQLPTQLRLHREFVLPARGDLPVELKIVDVLEVTHLGLVDIALAPIDERHERRGDRRPQRQHHSQFEQFHPVGEDQHGAGDDGQHQQHRQQDPTRPAVDASNAHAAGRIGHAPTVPFTVPLACRPARRFGYSGAAPSRSGSSSRSSGDLQQCCSHSPAASSAAAHSAATAAPAVSCSATRMVSRRGNR